MASGGFAGTTASFFNSEEGFSQEEMASNTKLLHTIAISLFLLPGKLFAGGIFQ